VLLPRVLAVTAGYIITFQPAVTKAPAAATAAVPAGASSPSAAGSAQSSGDNAAASKPRPAVIRSTSSADDAALAAAERANAAPFGLAFLKSKHRLIDLERITSKKDRPSVLTFHWKPTVENDSGPAPPMRLPSTSTTTDSPTRSPASALLGSDALASPVALPSPSSLSLRTASAASSSSSDSPRQSPSSSSASGAAAASSSTAAAQSPSRAGSTTMFLVDKPQECIALVRSKFLLAKAAAALAETNRRVQVAGVDLGGDAHASDVSASVRSATSAPFLSSGSSGLSGAPAARAMYTIGGPTDTPDDASGMDVESPPPQTHTTDAATATAEAAAAVSLIDEAAQTAKAEEIAPLTHDEQETEEAEEPTVQAPADAPAPAAPAVPVPAPEAQAPRLAIEALSPAAAGSSGASALSPSTEDLLEL